MGKKNIVALCIIAAITILFFVYKNMHLSPFARDSAVIQIHPANNALTSGESSDNDIVLSDKSNSPNENQKVISVQECNNFFETQKTTEELELEKQYQLTNFFRKLEKFDFTEEEKTLTADMAGITPFERNMATGGYNVSEYAEYLGTIGIHSDAFPYHKSHSMEDILPMGRAMDDKNYALVFEITANKQLDKSLAFIGNSVLAYAIQKNAGITKQDIQKFVEAGFAVEFDAIAYAVKQNTSLDIIQMLVNKHSGNLAKTWDENYVNNNLVLESTKRFRPDLVEYFESKGVELDVKLTDYSSGELHHNILDVLPAPKNKEQRNAFNKIALAALQKGKKPSLPSSVERLASTLSDNLKLQYKNQLNPALNANELVIKNADSLRAGLAKNTLKKQISMDIEQRCSAQHHIDKMSFVSDKLKTIKTTENLSLLEKKLIKKIILKNIEAEVNAKSNLKNKNEVNKKEDDLWSRFYSLASGRKYFEALDVADQLKALNPSFNMYPYIYRLASSDNASFDVYEALLARQIPLPDDLIVSLTTNDNMDIIKRLIPHGLNINGIDFLGENALSSAVRKNRSADMFNFLLELGVKSKPSSIGMDPLDIALDNMSQFDPTRTYENGSVDPNPYYVAELIKHGAPLERSHIEKISILKITNAAGVEYLQKLMPEYPL